MILRTVFMFSGQGSHYHQMGRELLDTDTVFRDTLHRLDALARRDLGESVLQAIYSRDQGVLFDRTALTHPAIFMIECALARSLIHGGLEPDLVLGASLGSFAAAVIAGYLDEAQALAAVIKQAAAFEACCERGGMLAVLGDPRLFDEPFLKERSTLAGVNLDSHFVISAAAAHLEEIEAVLRARDITHQRLPVSFPYHSRWIDDARAPFEAFVHFTLGTRARAGIVPLACCERAGVLTALPADFFWRVVRAPIRFRDTVAALERGGACRYVDVGPSGTLANFVKHGLAPESRSCAFPTLTPFGHDRKNVAALFHSMSATRRTSIDTLVGSASFEKAPAGQVSTSSLTS